MAATLPLPQPAIAALAGVAGIMGASYIDAKFAISRDLRQLMRDRAVGKRLQARIKQFGDNITLYHMMELCDPETDAFWFEGRTWTYREMKEEVDRLAWFLHQKGVQPAQFVGVYMTNSPEMFFTIYALQKLGATAALLNAALRSDTLLHCINVANASLILSTPDLTSFLLDVKHSATRSLECMSLNLGFFQEPATAPTPQAETTLITQTSLNALTPGSIPRPKRTISDIAALIYTSGTTGKPKAVSIKNFLLILVSTEMSLDADNKKKYYPLRQYSCLPLFHGTCFFSGLCYSVGNSATFCLARKFSASRFSKDLTDSKATRMLYVGELCRYLLLAPPSPYDRAHNCIVAWGNGLQKDVWPKFKARFGIPEIREVYRSTEGVAKFDNFGSGAAGAGKVGFLGPIARWNEDMTYIVRYDHGTEDLYRDPKTGFCVIAKLDEPGEAIGRVRSMATYCDYLNNPAATQGKLVKDVFKKGDLFQRTGDLLVHERDGWVRFHDRTGDTFRWKGENVAAGEVRGFIGELKGVHDAVVWGVKLPGYDGQCGAAGITLENDSSANEQEIITNLYAILRARGLPAYAVPRLVRFTKQMESGVTFKHAKDVLKKRTWHPVKNAQTLKDHLYWLDGEVYRPLQPEAWAEIEGARAKL